MWGTELLRGLKFYSKEKVILSSFGYENGNMQEILVEEGERIVGIKSQIYADGDIYGCYHCNPIFVFAKMK